MGRDRGDLGLLEPALDGTRHGPDGLDGDPDAAIEAALEVDRAGAGGDVADAVGEDGVREDGGGAGAVADRIAGALRRLADHLGAEVLGGILELHLLGDRDSIVADEWSAKAPLDEHALGLGAERHAHGIGEGRRAAQDLFASLGPEQDLFVRH